MTNPAEYDPTIPAPPMTVLRRADADEIGHGRCLPLVGGRRNYVYDVVPADGKSHIYADTPRDALTQMIPGYELLVASYRQAVAGDDKAATEDAYDALFIARSAYVREVRSTLQKQLNDEARADGRWDQLTDEERFQLDGAEQGGVPVGVMIERPWTDPMGETVMVSMGIWETPLVKLVIDRADYGLMSPTGTPEPLSELTTVDAATGELIVYITDQPENMLVLDSGDDDELLATLSAVGLCSIDVFLPQVEDAMYLDAVRLGRRVMAVDGTNIADYHGWEPDIEPAHSHGHDHAGGHSHDHGGHEH